MAPHPRASLLSFVALVMAAASACGGPAQPAAEPASVPPGFDPNAGAAVEPSTHSLAVGETPVAAQASGTGGTVQPPDAGPAVPPPVPSRSVEECATLATFDPPRVATEGGAQVVPWMVDPFGDKEPKKKGAKPDPRLTGIRGDFRQCLKAAKDADPSQVVAISMHHTRGAGSGGAEHKLCVKVNREDGREEVTKQLAQCMVQAIRKHPGH